MAVPKLDDIHLIRRLGPQEGTFDGLEEVVKSIGQYPSRTLDDLAKRIQTAGGRGGVTLDADITGAAVGFTALLGTETAVALGIESKQDVVDSAVNWAFLFGLGLGYALAAGRV